jgi:hypothetical protein
MSERLMIIMMIMIICDCFDFDLMIKYKTHNSISFSPFLITSLLHTLLFVSAELASQTNMVGKAKAKLEQVEEQLRHAR